MIRLLSARIFHCRLRPRVNRFRYGALYVTVPTEALAKPSRSGLFSVDRANLFSVRSRDYGDGTIAPHLWIRRVLNEWAVPQADGEIVLMTIPRVLGYAFNPVSFWCCFDREKRLRAVLAEVSNTFGERHSYLCFHEDRRPILAEDTLKASKVFHVSPFIDVAGEYAFRFSMTPEHIAISITLSDDKGVLLQTSVAGATQPLTSARILGAFLGNPLYALKIIGLIHYQAVKLFLKGISHFRKPAPPASTISH